MSISRDVTSRVISGQTTASSVHGGGVTTHSNVLRALVNTLFHITVLVVGGATDLLGSKDLHVSDVDPDTKFFLTSEIICN